GPTPMYGGERRCEDPPESLATDVACSGTDANPNPNRSSAEKSAGELPLNPKANVFEGVEGVTADRPVWYYQKTVSNDTSEDQTPYGVFRCNLRCHGVVMSTCFYIGNAAAVEPASGLNHKMNNQTNFGSDTWCAGGQEQRAPISFGSAPAAVQRFLAGLQRDLLPGLPGRDAASGKTLPLARR
ncbi:MAG: hypothetical protein ABIO65_02960, partial [Nitrospiria bacterium]